MGRPTVQIVAGPAGSGKSTFCHSLQEHCASLGPLRRRRVHVANLDPAAETFRYDATFDVRDLITVDDVMEELGLGPNGSLMYCMEYLLDNDEWLHDELDSLDDDEYLVLDCPGQIELYTHVPVMRRLIDRMRDWGFGGRMASVFVVDATFVCDAPKFISGSLLSLSAMIALELPHVNVLSKCDLVDEEVVDRVLDVESASRLWSMEEEVREGRLRGSYARGGAIDLGERYDGSIDGSGGGFVDAAVPLKGAQEEEDVTRRRATASKHVARGGATDVTHCPPPNRRSGMRRARRKNDMLTEAICSVLDDYSMVSFLPLNITDEESIDYVLSHIDHVVQYGEDLEVRGADMSDEMEVGFGDEEGGGDD